MSATPDAQVSLAEVSRILRKGLTPEAYFEPFHDDVKVRETNTTIRFHRIAHEATFDQANVAKLVDMLESIMTDFCCTRAEIEEAKREDLENNTTRNMSVLNSKARRLFAKKSPKTGEPGELILYCLAEHYLKYPQVLCKFPLKTNPEVHAHGADGVHASVDPMTKHLRLHWGEAKMYKDLGDALDDCCLSLSEMLFQKQGAQKSARRDIELIRDHIALADTELEDAILNYLDPDIPLNNKVKFCGIALVGFTLDKYEDLTTAINGVDESFLRSKATGWSNQMQHYIKKYELPPVTIDAFFIPLKCVDDFRRKFLEQVYGVSFDAESDAKKGEANHKCQPLA